MGHTSELSTEEAELGGSGVPGQLGLHRRERIKRKFERIGKKEAQTAATESRDLTGQR